MKKTTRTLLGCVGLALFGAGAEAGVKDHTDPHGRVVLRADGERVSHPPKASHARPPIGPTALSAGPALLAVRDEWRFAPTGRGIGEPGLEIVDLDADGDREIVVADFMGFWYVLERASTGVYETAWTSDPRDGLSALAVAQLDADPALEVVVATPFRLTVVDGATKAVERSWATAVDRLDGLSIADVDGDGALEATFCGRHVGSVYVHDLATGTQEYAGPPNVCADLAVGNVDADPGLEIVTANGTAPGAVLDGATRVVEWTNAFGNFVRLADLEADGIQEVLACFWEGVSIVRVPTQSSSGAIATFHLAALRVVDVEGDGPVEIVYGDGQWGGVKVHNGQTLALKWEVDNPEHGVTEVALGNLDGDGALELVWGAGATSTGPDYLYVVDAATRALEWRSDDLQGPFLGFDYGDVDGDGRLEIVHASYQSDAGYEGGRWFVRDAETKALEYASTMAPFPVGLLRTRTAQLDADPQLEILLTVAGEEEGISCVDGATHALQWAVPLDAEVQALAVVDVDGDGTLEVVATVGWGQMSDYLLVLDAATGAPEWQSAALGFGAYEATYLRIGNVDADANLEIVFARRYGPVYVVDGVTHALDNLGNQHTTALDLADRNNDGVSEILVGDWDGRLVVLSTSGTVTEVVATYAGELDAVDVVDVNGDGVLDYVLATQNTVRIRDGSSGSELWNNGGFALFFNPHVGALDGLRVANVDADDRLEIVVSLGMYGLRIYEIPSDVDLALTVADAPDPALVGSNVTYVWTVANGSGFAATGASLVVALPVNAMLVSSPPACTPSSGGLTCVLGALAANSSTNVTIVVAPIGPGTLGTHAWAGAAEPDPDVANNNASATTTVTSTVQADLAALIDDGRVLVGTGQTLTYAVSVANLGPWPVTSVRLVNPLPAALENPVYTPAVGSYDPGSGVWTGLDLQAGGNAQLTLTATVGATASGTIANPLSVLPPAGVDDLVAGNNSAVDVDVVAVDRTELQHGTKRTTVLDVAGDRYFAISQRPYSSYEVVVDQVSGDVGELASPLRLERLSSGLDVLTTASATGVGFSRSLRWLSTAATVVDGEAVRVRSASCTTDCGPDDAFRIRTYDTTYDLARFNNSGGQGTVVVLQNNGGAPASGRLYFWSGSGAILASVPFSALPPSGVLTVNTAALAGTAGLAGSITIANDAPYGTLAGKAVAVDPATGASFDTLLRPRPR